MQLLVFFLLNYAINIITKYYLKLAIIAFHQSQDFYSFNAKHIDINCQHFLPEPFCCNQAVQCSQIN